MNSKKPFICLLLEFAANNVYYIYSHNAGDLKEFEVWHSMVVSLFVFCLAMEGCKCHVLESGSGKKENFGPGTRIDCPIKLKLS